LFYDRNGNQFIHSNVGAGHGGKYFVTCPSLKGCQSQGSNIDEAIIKIKEVIELYLEDIKERQEHVPDRSKTLISLVTISKPYQ